MKKPIEPKEVTPKVPRNYWKPAAYVLAFFVLVYCLFGATMAFNNYQNDKKQIASPKAQYAYACADSEGFFITRDYAGLSLNTGAFGMCHFQGVFIRDYCFVPANNTESINDCVWTYG